MKRGFESLTVFIVLYDREPKWDRGTGQRIATVRYKVGSIPTSVNDLTQEQGWLLACAKWVQGPPPVFCSLPVECPREYIMDIASRKFCRQVPLTTQ